MRSKTSSCMMAGAAALLLTACADTAVLDNSYVSDAYNPYLLSYAAKRGGMMTEIVGNPFAVNKEEVDRSVTDTFRDHHFGPELDFIATPSDVATGDEREAFRVVVLFNPAINANPARLCETPARPQEPAPDRVAVLAAFCSTDTRVTSATGSVTGVTSPDDPAFKRLMRQLALELFPPRSPYNRDGPDFES